MLGWFKGNKSRPSYEIEPYGTLYLSNDGGPNWFGDVKLSMLNRNIELDIEVKGQEHPSDEQLKAFMEFEQKWPSLEDYLYSYMEKLFSSTAWEKDRYELKSMYYLGAITITHNTNQLLVVLEPEDDVPSIFNFLPRFTLRDFKISWSNME